MDIWRHDICHVTASRWCHICQNVSSIPSNRYHEAIFAIGIIKKLQGKKRQGKTPWVSEGFNIKKYLYIIYIIKSQHVCDWASNWLCLSGYLLKNYSTDFCHHSLFRKPANMRCRMNLNIIQNVVFWFIKKKKPINAIALITEFKYCSLFARWLHIVYVTQHSITESSLVQTQLTANIYPRRFIRNTNIRPVTTLRQKRHLPH